MNLRYILRVATNFALSIFALFALGAGLWTVDEFLNWNILPDWIDQYAQAFIPNLFRFYHAGPGGPDTVSGGEPRRS